LRSGWWNDAQNVSVLKKQVLAPRPGQPHDAYVKQQLSGLRMMKRLRIR